MTARTRRRRVTTPTRPRCSSSTPARCRRRACSRARVGAAQSLVAAVNAEKTTEGDKPTLTVAQVNAAIKAGILTEAVLAAYEYYYGTPYRG